MKLVPMQCPNCGATINVPVDTQLITCAYCSVSLRIERTEGAYFLQVASQISSTIRDVGVRTQFEIRSGAAVTREELDHTRRQSELDIAKLRLSQTESEIRLLEREKSTSLIRGQIDTLRNDRRRILSNIASLERTLGLTTSTSSSTNNDITEVAATGCGCSIFIVLALIAVLWIFGTDPSWNLAGIVLGVALVGGIIGAIIAFKDNS